MPYAFNLTLDPTAALQIERLYADLAALDVPDEDLTTQYGPCVTVLVVSDRIQAGRLTQTLEQQVRSLDSLPVTFAEPCVVHGTTPPTLGLRVRASEALLAIHALIYGQLPEAEVHLHYRPAYWQPHVKLCNIRERGAGDMLVAAITERARHLSGVLDRLEVIQYPPAQAIWQATLKPVG